MASALINGVKFELSISELIEFANCQSKVDQVVAEVVAAPKVNSAPKQVKANSVKVTEPVNSDNSAQVAVMANCGHEVLRNSARGRKPAMCEMCKGGSNSDSEAQEAPEKPQNSEKPQRNYRRGGGKREFDQAAFDKWLAEHADEPMSAKWEARIRWMITDGYKLTAIQSKKFLARLDRDPRLTVREAHNLRTEIRDGYSKK